MILNTSELSASHLSRATAILVVDFCKFGPKLDVWAENGAYGLCRLGWQYNGVKLYIYWPYMIVSMIGNFSKLSASHIISATDIFIVVCCEFGSSWIFGLKWSLWPVQTWLVVQRSKAVFFLTLYDIINDMKHLWTVYITPQPCHSHFCCWLLQIGPKLDVWAEKWVNGLCRLCCQYNGVNLYFSWPFMIDNHINYLRTLSITPQPCHSHFSRWLLQIWPKLDVWAECRACSLSLTCESLTLFRSE